jgi:hypothetical protein
VRLIASNKNVAVSASAFDRNRGAIERTTALLYISKGAQACNSVGIGSSVFDRNRGAIDRIIID